MAAAGCSPVHLVAVGGAPMLTRVPGRQTGDIDIVSEGLNDAVRDASRTVAARHNLTPAWINDGVKGFAVPIEVEPERIFTGKCLIVDSAGPRYLLATKLLSGREADEEDCIHLIRETGIYDEDELLDLIETAAGVRGLRPRDEYWAKEILVRARKGRRMRNLRGWFSSSLSSLRSLGRTPAPKQPEQHGATQGVCGKRNSSKGGRCTHPRPARRCGRCAIDTDITRDGRAEALGGTLWVPKTVMLLCLSTRELGEVPLVAFGEVAVVVEAPFEC